MNWYIHPDNQNLLWNTIHRIPTVSSVSLSVRENTFRSIVEYYYNRFQNRDLNISEKTQINRETISTFMQQIKDIPKPKTVESKQEKSQREFTERQQLYEQMTAKPETPSTELFLEKEDEAIQNIDDIIRKYQDERDKDMQLLPPPIETPLPKEPLRAKVSFSNTPVIIPKSLTIMEDAVLQIEIPLVKLQEMSERITECESLFLENELETYPFFSTIREKIKKVKESLDEYVREKV